MNLQIEHRNQINSLGRASANALRLLDLLYQKPLIKVPKVAINLGLSQPAARKAINNLQELKILTEISGKRRDRVYFYESYMGIIMEGTEL